MDGRWFRGCAAGMLIGMVGCLSPQVRSPAELVRDNEKNAAKMLKPGAATSVADAEPPRKDKKLKPETLVKLGALKDQAADDAERPQAERDAYRYQARQSYQMAIEQDPKHAQAYMALAGSYLKTGERDKAQATFTKALAMNPKEAGLWFEQGTIYARAKDWPAAVDSLRQATKLDPENKQFQKTLGMSLARCGHYDESYTVLHKCMSEEDARFVLARMSRHLKQTELCQKQLELAMKANPDYAPAREMLDEMSRGKTVNTAKFEEAVPPTPTPKAPEAPKLLPVLMGGIGAAPIAPVKIGFDGITD